MVDRVQTVFIQHRKIWKKKEKFGSPIMKDLMSEREKCYLLREIHQTDTKRYSLLGGRGFRLHIYICVFGFKQRKFCPLQYLESCLAGNSSWNCLQKNPQAPQTESLQQFQGRNLRIYRCEVLRLRPQGNMHLG